jgi:hypothetical protein
MQLTDLVWTIVGFFLTLFVFSYLLGDNPLFRLTMYLFVGVAAAYASVMVIYQVLIPKLILPYMSGTPQQKVSLLIPLVLSIMLVSKIIPKLSSIGNLPLGYLVGVGAGVAIGGAVIGTIAKQVEASINVFSSQQLAATGSGYFLSLVEGGVMLLGTICTLAYFHFGARSKSGVQNKRLFLVEWIAALGKIFIAITLGAIFAGVFIAALTALIERIDYIHSLFSSFI